MSLIDRDGLELMDPVWETIYQATDGWDGNIDPVWAAVYNVTGGWNPDQSTANFWAGMGDGASFGLTSWIRDRNGTSGNINKCSGAYFGGGVASALMTPIGRVGYIAQVSRIPKLAKTGRQAVSMRNMLRYQYRGPLTRIPFFARWHMRTYMSFVSRGLTDKAIIAGAANISRAWSAGLIIGPLGLSGGLMYMRSSHCGCSN
jgi:hypothetical protein